jgi:hypothetical protein
VTINEPLVVLALLICLLIFPACNGKLTGPELENFILEKLGLHPVGHITAAEAYVLYQQAGFKTYRLPENGSDEMPLYPTTRFASIYQNATRPVDLSKYGLGIEQVPAPCVAAGGLIVQERDHGRVVRAGGITPDKEVVELNTTTGIPIKYLIYNASNAINVTNSSQVISGILFSVHD